MRADSSHHVVEKEIKQAKRVEDFSDFISIINEHGKTVEMEFFDFFDIPKGVSQGKHASKKPNLDKVKMVKSVKGSFALYWKTDYTNTCFKSASFFTEKDGESNSVSRF